MRNRDYPLYDVPSYTSFSEMLKCGAMEAPGKIAIRQRKGKRETEEITYRQLYEDVRRATAFIRDTIGTKKRVSILGENSYEWLLAFFGIVCSGNVAVPTDKNLPAREIKVLLKAAGAEAVFVSESCADKVEGNEDLRVMSLGQLRLDIPENEGRDLPLLQTDKPSVIFITSGTVGKGKLVPLSQANLFATIKAVCQVGDTEGESVMAVLPFNHAFGLVLSVLAMLAVQKNVYITKSLKYIQRDIRESRPYMIMLVPLFVETFYKQIQSAIREQGKESRFRRGKRLCRLLLMFGIDCRRRIFRDVLEAFGGNLKWIVCGGASLDPFYIKEFRAIGIGIMNGYALTECGSGATINRNYYYKDGSVGRLIPGMEARISDEGEIELKGHAITQGYLNDPESTRESFTSDGWFRTGDLGYMDEDGFVFMTGRRKNLIILSNGENISPEELEAEFRHDEGVCEVVVYGDGNLLVAEIFPEEAYIGNMAYFRTLMRKLNEGRPLSKQISRIVLREEAFVKNTSGKIIRFENGFHRKEKRNV